MRAAGGAAGGVEEVALLGDERPWPAGLGRFCLVYTACLSLSPRAQASARGRLIAVSVQSSFQRPRDGLPDLGGALGTKGDGDGVGLFPTGSSCLQSSLFSGEAPVLD